MKKLVVLTAFVALTMGGLVQVASAQGVFGGGHPDDAAAPADGTGESPNSLDITGALSCDVKSDTTNDEITVTMTLQANVCSTSNEKQGHWRIHYDYDTGNGLVTDQTSGAGVCEVGTTSDDTSKVRCVNPNSGTTKKTGPGPCTVVDNVITCVIPYADLNVGGALASGDDVAIWCDTSRRGFVDAAPNRLDTDGCNKPELLSETVVITLD